VSVAPKENVWSIPSAPLEDLDLERDDDEAERQRRVMDLAAVRIRTVRARLEHLVCGFRAIVNGQIGAS